MKTNNDNLNTTWNNVYSTAISNWNSYSYRKVSIADSTMYCSDVDLFSYGGTIAEFEAEYCVGCVGVTLATNYATHPGANCGFDYPCATRIKYAGIIFTSRTVFEDEYGSNFTLTDADRTKTMVHEIGHALCLGHPTNSSTISIMKQGRLDYTIPQYHDQVDLSNYYNQLYN